MLSLITPQAMYSANNLGRPMPS